MLERAEVMPDCFGMSTAFKGPPKGVAIGGGKMAARCEKLLSVDCVTRPAANAGLFSVPEVDKAKKGMANENIDPNKTEPTMADLLAAVNELKGRLDEQDAFNQRVVEEFQGAANEPTIEDLASMTDEALAEIGITRAEVDAAMAELEAEEAAGAGKGEGDLEPAGAGEGDAAAGAGSPAGVDVSAPGAVAAALATLQKEIVELKNKNKAVELRAKRQAEDIELASIEEKAMTLAKQRDDAIEMAKKLTAERDALRLAVKTGTRPVTAGVDTGLRMFSANGEGELHEFQVRVKQLQEGGKSEAEAIRLAQKENPGSHADWVASLRKPKVA
jgi:uncharacterized protein YjiS (DUF1127 family)